MINVNDITKKAGQELSEHLAALVGLLVAEGDWNLQISMGCEKGVPSDRLGEFEAGRIGEFWGQVASADERATAGEPWEISHFASYTPSDLGAVVAWCNRLP
jgi:hypothetical protein